MSQKSLFYESKTSLLEAPRPPIALFLLSFLLHFRIVWRRPELVVVGCPFKNARPHLVIFGRDEVIFRVIVGRMYAGEVMKRRSRAVAISRVIFGCLRTYFLAHHIQKGMSNSACASRASISAECMRQIKCMSPSYHSSPWSGT